MLFLQVGLSLSMGCNPRSILPKWNIRFQWQKFKVPGITVVSKADEVAVFFEFSVCSAVDTFSLCVPCDCVSDCTAWCRVLRSPGETDTNQSYMGVRSGQSWNGWLSNGVRGRERWEQSSGHPLAQERWHIWENWTMLISVTRTQTRLVRHGSQEPN